MEQEELEQGRGSMSVEFDVRIQGGCGVMRVVSE